MMLVSALFSYVLFGEKKSFLLIAKQAR